MKSIRQAILVILDGWGVAPNWGGNAVGQATLPNFNKLWREYPHTTLHASGKYVGLAGDERGNSEVGHLNIGAGRIVQQDSEYIMERLSGGSLDSNQTMQGLIQHVRTKKGKIHLMGLCSEGGIHAHIDHLFALLDFFSKYDDLKNNIFIQAFSDGRDSDTQEALSLVNRIVEKTKQLQTGKIASISGRYYAMDRDNRWDRTKKAYDAIVSGKGLSATSPLSVVSQAYARGETDEFITPTVLVDDNQRPIATISDNDAVIYFNYRSDRARQMTLALTKEKFNDFKREKIVKDIYFVNMVPYGIESDYAQEIIHPLFTFEQSSDNISKVISEHDLWQLHIAETEKYAHVTYFFNGGVEKAYPKEDRILVHSPKVTTYDRMPGMSASEITKKMLSAIDKKNYSFVVVNYANADMVGHTGNFKATVKACEVVDEQIGKIYESVDLSETAIMIIADHGNADQMINPKTGKFDTEHNNNPVPCILVIPNDYKIDSLKNDMMLANVAPTILKLLNISKPANMSEPIF